MKQAENSTSVILPPQPPSWQRWRALRKTRGSLLRELMYERLRQIEFPGPVLDLGGGSRSDYAAILDTKGQLMSLNIEAALRPTVVADASMGLPFGDNAFAAILSLNTLEHVRCEDVALAEIVRVLRPGASLHIMVPFLYRVHGHPEDYHRHTAMGWLTRLEQAGIPRSHLAVEPLVWDPFSSAWAIADTAPLGRLWWRMRRLVRSLVLARPLLFGQVDRRVRSRSGELTAEYPLGYYIVGCKPQPPAGDSGSAARLDG